MSNRANQDARHREAVGIYYATGDEAALAPMLTELRPRLLALAKTTFGMRQPERAEDLVQQTLADLLMQVQAKHYTGTGTVAAYAGAHLRFLCLRSRRLTPSEPGTDDDPFRALGNALTFQEVEPEAQGEAAAVLTAATQAVLALDASARACVVLTYFHGLPAPTAAAQLGIAEDTFRTRLNRGLTALQAWGRTVARPAAEVYAALPGLDTGDLFREPLRLAG